jgi:hypothetical protein
MVQQIPQIGFDLAPANNIKLAERPMIGRFAQVQDLALGLNALPSPGTVWCADLPQYRPSVGAEVRQLRRRGRLRGRSDQGLGDRVRLLQDRLVAQIRRPVDSSSQGVDAGLETLRRARGGQQQGFRRGNRVGHA